METPTTPYENPVPVQSVPPPAAPVAPAPLPAKKHINPLLYVVAAALVLIIGSLVGMSVLRAPAPQVTVPTPTPTEPTPTPTPVRRLSLIASQSAFLQYQISVQSLSESINAYSPTDQTLNPPVLVLPLGITQ